MSDKHTKQRVNKQTILMVVNDSLSSSEVGDYTEGQAAFSMATGNSRLQCLHIKLKS